MRMYKLNIAAKRSSALLGAVGLLVGVGASAMPAFVSADSLNPLTDRSLSLSSSSPGWSYVDGSGNSTYAPPNSGANGLKTGNTFSFKVSTDSHTTNAVKAFTFQYCTTAAGTCMAPGNNGFAGTVGSYTGINPDSTTTSDLNIAASSPTEVSSGAMSTYVDTTTSDSSPTTHYNYGDVIAAPPADNSAGNFLVMTRDVSGNWTYSSGWSMTAAPNDDGGTVAAGTSTGLNNEVTLTNSGSGIGLHPGGQVKVMFFGTNTNYIENPGAGAFFVKINDYSDTAMTNLLDGGVTVANVMNQSIEIQTKVLETMDFSVGTVDPDTLSSSGGTTSVLHAANGDSTHGECDPVLTGMTPSAPANVLTLGDAAAENSLDTARTYATNSFFRLSSNSSGGATVYYAGSTLSNTESNQIAADGVTAVAPIKGSPQFGLALDNGTSGSYGVDYTYGATDLGVPVETTAAGYGFPTGVDSTFTTDTSAMTDVHAPQLSPLVPLTNYLHGTGGITSADSGGISTDFAFDANSNTVPTPMATESSTVVDCVTGRVRYAANIAATTPAGIYTTKVNYIASPQY
jgi:hypothetical protein